MSKNTWAYDVNKHSKDGFFPYIPHIHNNSKFQQPCSPPKKYNFIPKREYCKEYKPYNSPSYHPPLFQVWPRY